MKYLLDTNTCVQYLNRRSESLIEQMQRIAPEDIAVCSVTRAELIFGAMKSRSPEKTRALQREFLKPFASPPFDDIAAEVYGTIRAQLETRGTPIGPNDLLIASIALANGLTIVTHNTREFRRVQQLEVVAWELR